MKEEKGKRTTTGTQTGIVTWIAQCMLKWRESRERDDEVDWICLDWSGLIWSACTQHTNPNPCPCVEISHQIVIVEFSSQSSLVLSPASLALALALGARRLPPLIIESLVDPIVRSIFFLSIRQDFSFSIPCRIVIPSTVLITVINHGKCARELSWIDWTGLDWTGLDWTGLIRNGISFPSVVKLV